MAVELLNVDCMEYMSSIEDNAFDLAIVDPPYGRGEDGGTSRNKKVKQKNGSTIECFDGGYENKDWDREPPPIEYFNELMRVSRNQIIWGINYFDFSIAGGAIVWDKVNDGSHQSDCEIAYCSLNQRVDMIRYMWRGMMQGESIENGTKMQGNKKLNEKRIHPTQKPRKLYQWLFGKYAKPGDRVLDTHLGSASIAIEAHYGGFDFVGCEIDPDYYKSGKQRFNQETSQIALFQPQDKP